MSPMGPMGMGIVTIVLTGMGMGIARWEWEGVKTPRFPFASEKSTFYTEF